MTNKLIKACIVFLLSSVVCIAQPPTPLQRETHLLAAILKNKHISPRAVNDQLAKDVFLKLIESVDPQNMYFSASEITTLKRLSLDIDADLINGQTKFILAFSEIFKRRLIHTEKVFTGILAKPLKFSANEKLTTLLNDSLSYAKDEAAFANKWSQWLKYQMLWYWTSQADEQQNVTANEFEKLENVYREKALLIEKRKIRRILDNSAEYDKYIQNLYFQAITSCYDPHSTYMSKEQYLGFEEALATENLSLGIEYEMEENGILSVARLVPGGPAWKSNQLNKGDQLLEISWEGKKAIDLAGADLEELDELISSANLLPISLKVRKANGMVAVVTLRKEKIREEENIVRSFILNGEKKIGYISLPGFYTEWENSSSLGCANDVAKEIIKLKAEKVDGLILDIRNNGGGSLNEGLNLSGIFINEGPLLMMQVSHQKLQVVKDANRGTIYDGPMVVMVNGFSASASELVASTLQDYHRAIIVGSNTYGKATGQLVLPLDTNIRDLSNFKSPYGLVKLTMNKLFRITGKSAQLKGVKPDVVLPDIYASLNENEAHSDFALSGDSVNKKVLYAALPALPVNILAEKSKKRLEGNPIFENLRKHIEDNPWIKRETFQNIPLSPVLFRERFVGLTKWYSSLKISDAKVNSYKVESIKFNTLADKMDSYTLEMLEVIVEGMNKDLYLEESYKIIEDYINILK
ncbi:MAG TPA: S41 family peptidase [Cytophagaceae bacterium]|jgi:carboxyl-terminal processing protease